jgi:hypothetical protein
MAVIPREVAAIQAAVNEETPPGLQRLRFAPRCNDSLVGVSPVLLKWLSV